MGCFYPFVSKAMTGENAPGPYAVLFFFVMGVAACSIPVNYLLMRMPLDGREAASMRGYWQASGNWQPVGHSGRHYLVCRRNDEFLWRRRRTSSDLPCRIRSVRALP